VGEFSVLKAEFLVLKAEFLVLKAEFLVLKAEFFRKRITPSPFRKAQTAFVPYVIVSCEKFSC
jgi:hypothetical protein